MSHRSTWTRTNEKIIKNFQLIGCFDIEKKL